MMNVTQIYITISIVVLLVIALLFIVIGKSQKRYKLTPLAGIAFGFVLAGIIFGENRLVGYSLLGIGVILSVVDSFKRFKSKKIDTLQR
jgi:hypothetical protein